MATRVKTSISWSVDAGNRVWMKVSSPVSARRGTEIAQAILEKIRGRIKIGNFHRVNKQWNLVLLKIICPSTMVHIDRGESDFFFRAISDWKEEKILLNSSTWTPNKLIKLYYWLSWRAWSSKENKNYLLLHTWSCLPFRHFSDKGC